MSVKHYGIYTAYPPTVDLRDQGLGRYLAALLRGAQDREDVRFTVVCPSWCRDTLDELFVSEGVDRGRVFVASPEGVPYVLRFYFLVRQLSIGSSAAGWIGRASHYFGQALNSVVQRFEQRMLEIFDVWGLLRFVFSGLPLAAVLFLVAPLLIPIFLYKGARRALIRVRPLWNLWLQRMRPLSSRLSELRETPQDVGYVLRLFYRMQSMEHERMLKVIGGLENIKGWYCPTAFWPEFCQIDGPKIMCVPDVVLSDFPVGFATTGGERVEITYGLIEKALSSGSKYVTYSNAVKWSTLVDAFGVDPDDVSVIPHAPSRLNEWINIDAGSKSEQVRIQFCRNLLRSALRKSTNQDYVSEFENCDFEYIFYASQFRPNKNLLTLLRAYEFLLRSRYLQIKLLLTGNPNEMKEVGDFIRERSLENDVICLPGLSVVELAACYKLSMLAVNPSLSEGGCPFTFTEAISVETPVVMADIPVTREVLGSSEEVEVMLFDPYDWKDLARRVEWALENRETLLALQTPIFMSLAARTWRNVADEHVALLERIGDEVRSSASVVT